MKKFLKNLFKKIVQKIIKKSVNAAVEKSASVTEPDPELVEGTEVVAEGNSKKAIWKFIIQTLISILTAILTALGATSCVNAL